MLVKLGEMQELGMHHPACIMKKQSDLETWGHGTYKQTSPPPLLSVWEPVTVQQTLLVAGHNPHSRMGSATVVWRKRVLK